MKKTNVIRVAYPETRPSKRERRVNATPTLRPYTVGADGFVVSQRHSSDAAESAPRI